METGRGFSQCSDCIKVAEYKLIYNVTTPLRQILATSEAVSYPVGRGACAMYSDLRLERRRSRARCYASMPLSS